MQVFRFRISVLCLLLAGLAIGLLSSCASEDDFKDRLDKRNQSYSKYNDRRKARLEARQERTDMWFKRIMGTD